MTIPKEVQECVCYLSVKVSSGGVERFRHGGTCFFVGIKSEAMPDTCYPYLVTAKHCVERAKNYGDLYLRVNKKEGGFDFIQVNSDWVYSENEGVDIAVTELVPSDEFQIRILPFEMLATSEMAQKISLGIGDNIYITGLFTERYGTHRNIPIVRSGIIAAMPDEPLQDSNTGFEYDAYLVEVRSIGGLSGSPVIVEKAAFLGGDRQKTENLGLDLLPPTRLYLLGLIRGHWDYKNSAESDYIGNELSTVNMGIAIVTPAQDLADILNGEGFMKKREKNERKIRTDHEPTLDSGFSDSKPNGSITREGFEDALKRASWKISSPDEEKNEIQDSWKPLGE